MRTCLPSTWLSTGVGRGRARASCRTGGHRGPSGLGSHIGRSLLGSRMARGQAAALLAALASGSPARPYRVGPVLGRSGAAQ